MNPLCKTCKFFRNDLPFTAAHGVCARPSPSLSPTVVRHYFPMYDDVLRESVLHPLASDSRRTDGACGPLARLYEREPSGTKRFLNVHGGTVACVAYVLFYVLTIVLSIEVVYESRMQRFADGVVKRSTPSSISSF